MSEPKISINKLGEYLDATPVRRRRIVQDQKDPKAFVAARYTEARDEILNYVATGMKDDDRLIQAATQLREADASSEFVRQDNLASADAIEDFLDVSDVLDISGLTADPCDKNLIAMMKISGVSVSVRPDMVLRDAKSGSVVGALKLHFSKTNPLSEKSREYVATALRVYLYQEGYEAVDHGKCLVIDVPTKKLSAAPKAFKRKMSDIEAACEEIEARWRKAEEVQ